MAKFENVLFWILIMLIIGIAIWKIIGSPTDTTALIAITLFISNLGLIPRALGTTDLKDRKCWSRSEKICGNTLCSWHRDSKFLGIFFISGSEILLWKSLFNADKKTAIGFNNVKILEENSILKDGVRILNIQKTNKQTQSFFDIKNDINSLKNNIGNLKGSLALSMENITDKLNNIEKTTSQHRRK